MNINIIILLLLLPATFVILGHSLDLASTLSRKQWVGHPFRFAGFSISIALTAGGAVGVLLGAFYAPALLVLGVAGCMMFDRRR